jgi:hypothetical protein
MAVLASARAAGLDAGVAARISRGALSRALGHDAELLVATLAGDVVALGAFQRAPHALGAPHAVGALGAVGALSERESEGAREAAGAPLVRRGTGGTALRLGAGQVFVQLALARPDALTPCDVTRAINRYVRPILRALGKTAGPAAYFGRDWVAVQRRPAAWIGVAHERASGRTVVECVIPCATAAVGRPMWIGDAPTGTSEDRPPGSLEAIAGKPVAPERVAGAIADAFREAYAPSAGAEAELALDLAASSDAPALGDDPPFEATARDAIGLVGAGRDASGALTIGGDFMASRDAIADLHARIAALAPAPGADLDAVSRAVDAAFGAPGTLLFGARATTIRDVAYAALAARRATRDA